MMKVSAAPLVQVVAVGDELRASRQDRLLHAVVRSHVYVAVRTIDVDHGWAAALDMDVAFGDRVLHRVVRLEKHGDLVRSQGTRGLLNAGIEQDGLPRRPSASRRWCR